MDNNPNTKNDNYNKIEPNESGNNALALSLVLIGVLLVCFILSGGNFDEDRGMVWLLAGFYCYLIEPPIIIISTIYALKGLKYDVSKIPSYASILINFGKILFVLLSYAL